MKLFDVILQSNETEEEARDFARGYVWCESEMTEQPMPTHSHYVDTVDGIKIYYDYGADYYFFSE